MTLGYPRPQKDRSPLFWPWGNGRPPEMIAPRAAGTGVLSKEFGIVSTKEGSRMKRSFSWTMSVGLILLIPHLVWADCTDIAGFSRFVLEICNLSSLRYCSSPEGCMGERSCHCSNQSKRPGSILAPTGSVVGSGCMCCNSNLERTYNRKLSSTGNTHPAIRNQRASPLDYW